MRELLIAVIGMFGGGTMAAIYTAWQRKGLVKKEGRKVEAETDSLVVATLKQAIETINREVIGPLKNENEEIRKEIKRLNYEVIKLRKSIEKIPACAHADTCPVARELQNAATDTGGAGQG